MCAPTAAGYNTSMATNKSDNWRIALNLIFSVAQIAGGWFYELTGIGTSIQAQSVATQTPVIPAGYAFSIWGLIFGLSLAYAIYQALPSQRHNKLLRHIGWLTAAAFFGNTLWEVVAQTLTFNWPTAIIIFAILVPSLAALLRLTQYQEKHTLSLRELVVVFLPVSILAGWVSAATFANISSVINQEPFNNFGIPLLQLSAVIIIAAAVFATLMAIKTRGNLGYIGAVVWALAAIIIANIETTNAAASILAALGILPLAIAASAACIR